MGGQFDAAALNIVDDHPVVRRGLKQILADEPDMEVCEAADTHEALAVARALDLASFSTSFAPQLPSSRKD